MRKILLYKIKRHLEDIQPLIYALIVSIKLSCVNIGDQPCGDPEGGGGTKNRVP